MKFSLIKWSLDNIIYESNMQNADFNYLPFDGGEGSVDRGRLYCINDDILYMLNNGSIVYL